MLFEDLDERALARARCHCLHHGAQRAGGLAAAADDLAEVRLGDLELVHVRVPLLDELDADFIRLLDEVHCHVADQLRDIRALDVRAAAVATAIAVAVAATAATITIVAVAHHAGLAAARAVRRMIEARVPEGCAPTESHFW